MSITMEKDVIHQTEIDPMPNFLIKMSDVLECVNPPASFCIVAKAINQDSSGTPTR